MRYAWFGFVGLAAISLSARAQEACEAPLSIDALVTEVLTLEQALRDEGDLAVAAAGQPLLRGAGCLGDEVPRGMRARIYRAVAATELAANHVEGARDWMRRAVALDDAFVYGVEDLSVEHGLVVLLEEAQAEVAKARVADAVQEPVKLPDSDYVEAPRERPREKTPLYVAGVTAVVGSAALYGYSFHTREQMQACTDSTDCVYKYTEQTNRLNLAAWAVAGAGVASLTWGAMVSEGGGPMAHFGLRF